MHTRLRFPLAAILTALFLVAQPLAGGVTVVINEFQASNGETIADEDGDFEDWIELYNHGSEPVLLGGYGLSDDEERPFRWVLPDVSLGPGEFLLVFASNKDRTDGPFLHTNFAISSGGEELLLTAPDGARIDFVPPTAVPRDISFGRNPDGVGEWFFFDAPTPGTENTTEAYLGILDPPVFSHEGGFYEEAFFLSITPQETGTAILYTIDGSEPSWENTGGRSYFFKNSFPFSPADPMGPFMGSELKTLVYDGAIGITPGKGRKNGIAKRASTIDFSPAHYIPKKPIFKGTVVRARVVKEGQLASRVVTHTYFVTPEGAGRYTLPVIALATDSSHLFCYEDGIYTAGIDFDEWRAGNADDVGSWRNPANFNRRGIAAEYPVHAELFTRGHGRVWSQNVGLRIHGDSTRVLPQKSLRLYARNAYDETNVMAYPFIEGLTQRASGEPRDEYRRIILRNSGQDWRETRFRDAFVQTLFAPLGIDHQAYEPAVVFINGEYWGLLNIRERIDHHYFAAHYGIDPEAVVIIDNRVNLRAGESADLADLLALREFVDEHDLSIPANLQHVSDRMDVDNFLRYNLAQIYVANTDWPAYNRRAWRVGSGNAPGSLLSADDGRWRWAIFDLDVGFGPWPSNDGGYHHDTLTLAVDHESPVPGRNADWATVKLRNLLENEQIAALFINLFADHMNTTFRPSKVEPLIDELHGRIQPYLAEHAARWRDLGDTSPQFLKDFGRERPSYMRQHIVNYFNLEGTYELTIAMPPDGAARVRVNSIELEANGEEWTGIYFLGVPIEVEILPEFGHEFIGWEGAFEGEGTLLQLNPGSDLELKPILKEDAVTLHEVVLPRFMQGESPDNNDRVPFSARLRIEGLLPNALYRFANRVVTPDDPPTQNGAGNAIYFDFATETHFRTTDTPDFSEPGTHGEFITDGNGVYEGWFTLEPSGNPRFGEPELFIRVLLNDGLGGEEYRHFLTTENTVQVLPFGFGWDAATGIYATSPLTPGDVVVLHDDLDGAGRPLTATLIEDAGFEVDDRYAAFYEQFVSGFDGHFGALLPNLLPDGLRRIESFDWFDAASTAVYTSTDGFWPDNAGTVNPDGGLGFPFALTLGPPDSEVPGDVNGDGVVNAVDVQLVINAALGIVIDPAYRPDINNDGVINAVDVQLVINAALGV